MKTYILAIVIYLGSCGSMLAQVVPNTANDDPEYILPLLIANKIPSPDSALEVMPWEKTYFDKFKPSILPVDQLSIVYKSLVSQAATLLTVNARAIESGNPVFSRFLYKNSQGEVFARVTSIEGVGSVEVKNSEYPIEVYFMTREAKPIKIQLENPGSYKVNLAFTHFENYRTGKITIW